MPVARALAAVALSSLLLLQTAQAGGGDKTARPDRFVVQIDPTSGTSIEQLNATYNTYTERALRGIRNGYVIRTRNNADAKTVFEHLKKDKRLVVADSDSATLSIGANPARSGAWGLPTPPGYFDQDAVRQLNLPQAHAISRGAGMIVAIIDTGISRHPDLTGNLVAGYDFVDDDADASDVANGIDDNGNGHVDEVYGHGTHIAGIVKLVAPDAKLMPLRVIDADGRGLMLDVVQAFAFAINNGAHVINLSLGSDTPSGMLDALIRQAADRGIVVVASAGNLSSDAEQYPAAADCVIGVISTDVANGLSSFSSYGKWVDFSAPGEAIYSTYPDNGYAHWSGTSMAAPFVAGQAALMRSVAPSMPLRTLVQAMDISAVDLSKLKLNSGYKGALGMGRINIGASVQIVAAGRVDMSGKKKIKGGC
jgi:thermitase